MTKPTDPNPLDLVEPMLLGELDDAQLEAIERWLAEDEAHRAAYLREVQLCRGIRRALFSEESSLALDDSWDEDDLEIVSDAAEPDVLSEVIGAALAERRRHEVEEKAQRLLLENQAKHQPRRRPAPGHEAKPQWVVPLPLVVGAMAAMLLVVVYVFAPGDDGSAGDPLAGTDGPTTRQRTPRGGDAPVSISVASVEQSHEARWAGGASSLRPQPDGQMAAGVYALTSGAVRLRTEHGAVLMIDGPARFELRHDNTGRLISGRLTADARDAEPGFRLTTPTATIENLGATFGVQVGRSGQTQAYVFAGRIDLSGLHTSAAGGDSIRLSTDDSAVVDSTGGAPRATPVASEQFALEMAALTGEPVVAGDADYHRHMPRTVVMNRGPQSPRAWVVLESSGRPLQRGTDWAQGYPERPRMLTDPEGRVVDSYLIVFDPDDETQQFKTADFTLTFPGEVLTVITEDAGLAQSHGWYGDPDTQYTLGPRQVDGLEGEPGRSNPVDFVPDTVEFSVDGRTLRVFLGVHNGADVLRVLVVRRGAVGSRAAREETTRIAGALAPTSSGLMDLRLFSTTPNWGFTSPRPVAARISLKGEKYDG
ncbi:FecR domain-containing protein [Phycisphaeraceae bacterium D3-23]